MDRYQIMLKEHATQTTTLSPPLHLYVEPTNQCNLRCSHCSRQQMKRPRGFIELSTCEHIAEECQKWKIPRVYLYHMGEPLSHPKINDIIDIFHKREIKVKIHTNGTIFNEYVKNHADEIHISLNETSMTRIESVVNKWLESRKDIVLEQIEGISVKIPESWKPFVHVKNHLNWRGFYKAIRPMTPDKFNRCNQPYKTMMVLWDGTVVACCQTWDADEPVGNILKEGLMDIWNGKKMREIRRSPYNYCKNCEMAYIGR